MPDSLANSSPFPTHNDYRHCLPGASGQSRSLGASKDIIRSDRCSAPAFARKKWQHKHDQDSDNNQDQYHLNGITYAEDHHPSSIRTIVLRPAHRTPDLSQRSSTVSLYHVWQP
jgi:hypothetical protein